MTSIRRTAYPRFQSHLTHQELEEIYQPTEEEIHFVRTNARGDAQQLTLLLFLKCHQHLGYPPSLALIPEPIHRYLCHQLAFPADTPMEKAERTVHRYRQWVRTYLNIYPYAQGGADVVASATRAAAHTMSDPADLINVAIERLIHHRYAP